MKSMVIGLKYQPSVGDEEEAYSMVGVRSGLILFADEVRNILEVGY